MSIFRNLRAALAAAATTALLAACGGESAASAAPAGPAASVASGPYRLTMERVRVWLLAQEVLAEVVEERPELEESLLAAVDDSLGDHVARIEASAELRAALARAGLTPREYAQIVRAMIEAGMGELAVEAGADADEVRRSMEADPANLDFFRLHEAELEALFADSAGAGDAEVAEAA